MKKTFIKLLAIVIICSLFATGLPVSFAQDDDAENIEYESIESLKIRIDAELSQISPLKIMCAYRPSFTQTNIASLLVDILDLDDVYSVSFDSSFSVIQSKYGYYPLGTVIDCNLGTYITNSVTGESIYKYISFSFLKNSSATILDNECGFGQSLGGLGPYDDNYDWENNGPIPLPDCYTPEAIEEYCRNYFGFSDRDSYEFILSNFNASYQGDRITVCFKETDFPNTYYGGIMCFDGEKAPTVNGFEYIQTPSGDITITGYYGEENEIIVPEEIEEHPVTRIGAYAFYNCTSITSVALPDSITSIGTSAFENCKSLSSILLPDCISEIGDCAFRNCDNLLYLSLPDSVTSIGKYAFAGCAGIANVTIPYGVTRISDYVFSGCTGLKSVTAPDSVTSIGNSSFRDCTGLTGVTIPDSVTSIGYFAFSGCTGLTNVTIPNSVTDICWHAFSCCTGLTGVTIPNSVTSMGLYAFPRCSSLETVTIDMATVPSYAFSGLNSIKTVILGDHVRSISDYAFSGCTGLTSVSIPDSVTSIGHSAFRDCTGLTSVTIPVSVTSIGDSAFLGCSGLTSVTIPVSVTSIGDSAFSGCAGLTSVVIPDSVTSIGNEAFYCSTGLTSVTIPDSVTSIGSFAFYGCLSLETINLDMAIVPSAFAGLTSIKTVILGDHVTSLGNYAFSGCTGLKNMTIPDSVTSMGSFTFQNCTGLMSVTIPDSVTSIGDSAFLGCSGLTSVTIPNSVTSIGSSAFNGCNNLKFVGYAGDSDGWNQISIGYSNGYLTDSVRFYEVESGGVTDGFTYLVKKDGTSFIVKYSGDGGELVIPSVFQGSPLTEIYSESFRDCSGLTSVTIPDSVTSISDYAFSGCVELTRVTIPDSVTSIGNSAFSGCSGLTSVTIPDGVTNIGDSAFSGCSGLTSVTIPDSVTSIGNSAFSGCSGLTSVTISDSVTSIGGSAFSGCTGLGRISIPESVTEINTSAFKDCSSVEEVYFGDGIQSVRDSAFDGCSALKKVYYTGTESDWYRKVYVGDHNEYLRNAEFVFEYHVPAPEYVAGKDATCTEDGNVGYWRCTVCGKFYSGEGCENEIDAGSVVIPARGHSFGEWTVKTAPTCTVKGAEERVCSRCGDKESRDIDAPGHDYVDEIIAPTCTEQGYTTHTCKVCGDAYVDTYVEALGHTFGADGRAEKCSVCGEKNPDYKPPVNFNDVKAGAYYADAVAWAVANGITSGTSSTTFSPDEGCTRGQVVTFLWRAAGSPEPTGAKNPFRDVKESDYFYKAVMWAVENGVTSGTSSTTFSPNNVCTRGQIVTFQWRANGQPKPKGSANPFKDVKADDYFYSAVLWAVENNVTAGTSKTTFSPNDTCTRGQVVTFLFRDMA